MKTAIRRLRRERKTWGALVGRFVLAFGDVENVTYLALLQLPKDKIFDTTSTLGFGKRIDLVIELIAGHRELTEDLRKSFATTLTSAKKLSDLRNIVAHSPLMMMIYAHPKEGWTHHEMALGNVRNRRRGISLKQLRVATGQAEALSKKLYRLYSKVHKAVANDEDA